MMNYNLFRRVTSSFVASLFILSFGVGSVKPVRADNTKRLDFCKQNKSLFHINEGAERKVKVAVLDFETSSYKFTGSRPTSVIKTTGLGNVLESKLLREDNLDVFKLDSSYKSNPALPYPNSNSNQSLVSTNNLTSLRQIRDKNGVEAVIVVSVMQFQTNEQGEGGWLITKKKHNEKIDIKLNLQVVDTTTGEIVLQTQGHGSKSGNTLTQVNLPFSVQISRLDKGTFQDKKWNRNNGNYSISFKLGTNATSTPIYSKTSTITEKLVAEATEKAMEEIKTKLNQQIKSAELPCLLRKPTLVAWVNKDKTKVILNKGKSHGYCKGMIFLIERGNKVITDPATGRVITTEAEKVGKVELISVDAGSSVGKLVKEKDELSNTHKSSIKNGKSFQRMDIAKLTSDSKSKCSENTGQNNFSRNPGMTNRSQFLRLQQQQEYTNP